MKIKNKIRLTIFAKLFLALFIVVTMLAVGIVVFTNWSFRTGLADLKHAEEIKQVEKVAKRLEREYALYKNWGFVSYSPQQWRRFVSRILWKPTQQSGQRRQPKEHKSPPPHAPPPLSHQQKRPRPKPVFLEGRVSLLDPNKQLIAGRPIHLNLGKTSFLTHIALKYNNQVVGLLTIRQGKGIFAPLAETFLQQQLRNSIYVAAFSLVIALLAALILVRFFIRPVRTLSTGTEKLTSGQLDTRIAIDSNDEFADLAHDFNQLAKTLEKNETQRKQWLVDISHELRTPIAVLQSEIEAIIDGIRQPTEERILSLHHDVLALGKLVNDLYQLSLSDSHEITVERCAINLHDVLSTVVRSAEALLQKKQIEVMLQADDLGAWIEGDEKSLYQLFSNLLENSSRYTHEQGKVIVTLAVKNNLVEVQVADSAPAVPSDSLPLLFDRLYRVDQSRNRASGGSGLGLAICDNIVKTHNGSVQAEHSTLGGLLIRIHFPLLNN